MQKSQYLEHSDSTLIQKTLRNSTKMFSAFIACIFMLLPLIPAAINSVNNSNNAEAFDVGKWVMCKVFKDSPIAQAIYVSRQTDAEEFALFSKSTYGYGMGYVDGSIYNLMLEISGQKSFGDVNRSILGRDLYKQRSVKDDKKEDNKQGESGEKKVEFNGGEQVTPFDRFGVSGLNWSGYLGEWKYLEINPCDKEPKARDTKTNQFYEKRLVPQATYENRDSSVDPRVQLHYANSVSNNMFDAVLNVIANIVFSCAKLFVVFVLALINFSFVDIAELLGINNAIIGTSDKAKQGIFNVLFNNFFMGLIVLFIAATGLHIFFSGVVRRQYRNSLNLLSRTIALFLIAIFISVNPAFWISIPNKATTIMQVILASGMSQELRGQNELCSIDGKSTSGEKLVEKDVDVKTLDTKNIKSMNNVLEDASQRIRSSVGCSFWQMLLFEPWVEGQFGTDWNNLWAFEKKPDWAKDGKTLPGDYPDNIKMVGDATVPLGGGKVVNNWALFHLSTQTNAHGTIDKNTEMGQFTSEKNNDWWRVVDVLSSYEEKDDKITDPSGGGTTTPPSDTAPPETPPADTGQPSTPPADGSGEKLMWPTKSRNITSKYGMRKHPVTGVYKLHGAIDIGVPQGTEVYAAASGVVVQSDKSNRAYGNRIKIKHNDKLFTAYNHLMDGGRLVKVGDKVVQGQLIGKVGSTGYSTGAHLDFEVYVGGESGSNRQNPVTYLGKDLKVSGPLTSEISNTAEQLSYGTPKDNPPLEYWEHWIGKQSWNRILVSFSAGFFAFIVLAAPGFFALMSAVFSIGIAIIVAFAPIFLLAGCYPRGWDIFKQWVALLINTMVKKLIFSFLMILSIIFVSAVMDLMGTLGWWEAVVLMAILSIVLISGRHKIVELFTIAKLSSGKIGEIASSSVHRARGSVTSTAKSGVNLVSARAAASSELNKAGVKGMEKKLAMQKARRAALLNEARSLSYHNNFLRDARVSYDKAKGNVDAYCESCRRPLAEYGGDSVAQDPYGNWYCQDCFFDHGKEKMLTDYGVNPFSNEYKNESSKTKSVFVKDSKVDDSATDSALNTLDKIDRFGGNNVSKNERANTTDMLNLARYAGMDIERFRKLKGERKGTRIVPPEIPPQLKPFINEAEFDRRMTNKETEIAEQLYAEAILDYVAGTFNDQIRETEGKIQSISESLDEALEESSDKFNRKKRSILNQIMKGIIDGAKEERADVSNKFTADDTDYNQD